LKGDRVAFPVSPRTAAHVTGIDQRNYFTRIAFVHACQATARQRVTRQQSKNSHKFPAENPRRGPPREFRMSGSTRARAMQCK